MSESVWQVIGARVANALQLEGVYVVDDQRRIIAWNQAAEILTGFSAPEVLGRACRDDVLCHVDAAGHGLCDGQCPMTAALRDGEPKEVSVYLHRKDRTLMHVDVRAVPVVLASGERVVIETFVDSDHAVAGDLRSQAMIDALTGLPNRGYYDRMVADFFASRERTPGLVSQWAIVVIDGDGLKAVNDAWGHQAGDAVIRGLADEFRATARRMDFLARWAGDEFVLLVRRCAGGEQVERIAERLRVAARRVQRPDGSRCSVSIGAAVAAEIGNEPERAVFARADAAMQRAKADGRDRVVVVI